MIDYKIENGAIDFTNKGNSLQTLMYMSLHMRRGAWFLFSIFGCRWHTIKFLDNDGLARAEDYAREALKWLLDIGRLDSLDIVAQVDLSDSSRCNVKIDGIKNSAVEVSFETFFKVV